MTVVGIVFGSLLRRAMVTVVAHAGPEIVATELAGSYLRLRMIRCSAAPFTCTIAFRTSWRVRLAAPGRV